MEITTALNVLTSIDAGTVCLLSDRSNGRLLVGAPLAAAFRERKIKKRVKFHSTGKSLTRATKRPLRNKILSFKSVYKCSGCVLFSAKTRNLERHYKHL